MGLPHAECNVECRMSNECGMEGLSAFGTRHFPAGNAFR
jgi:hypothetical protein